MGKFVIQSASLCSDVKSWCNHVRGQRTSGFSASISPFLQRAVNQAL